MLRRRVVRQLGERGADAAAYWRVKCLLLLTGTGGQLDIVGSHPALALGQFGVHVRKPEGAPVVCFPLGKRLFRRGAVGSVF